MRDAVVKVCGIFDHLVLFHVHRHRRVHSLLAFHLHRKATAAAMIEPTAFGSAAERRTRYTTVVRGLMSAFWVRNLVAVRAPQPKSQTVLYAFAPAAVVEWLWCSTADLIVVESNPGRGVRIFDGGENARSMYLD